MPYLVIDPSKENISNDTKNSFAEIIRNSNRIIIIGYY
jgi:hypothetical protein